MNCTPHEPVGATVTDLALAEATADEVADLRALLADHGVLVFPRQELDDDAFVAFLRRFGPLTFTAGETHVDGCPDLNVVTNAGRTTPPKSSFHVDTSYVDAPPAYTALRAVTVPARGGATQFTNQFRAWETLPDAVRDDLAGRTITHVVTGVAPDAAGDQTSADHPIARPHPSTGRIALYLTTPPRCAAVSGQSDEEAEKTVADLFAHSTRADNVFAHAWAPGDVVMWDNAAVLHRADHADVDGERTMHRGMVA